MPPSPGWTWAISLTLATTVAWKQQKIQRARMEALASTSTTATAMEGHLVLQRWSPAQTPMQSHSESAAGHRLTATPIQEIIDENSAQPDLDSEELHDPEAQHVSSSICYVDFVSPLHRMIFDNEETVTEEQFGWTLLGILLSAALGQCRKVTVAVLKLLLMACPRLRWALRQILGVARLLEDAVQEVEAEHPNLVKQPDPQFSAVDEPQALVETSEHEKQPEFTSTPCNAARHRV